MTTLVIAEHHDRPSYSALAHAVSAAQHWQSPVHVLVMGSELDAVVTEVASIAGVERVLTAQADHLAHPLAEDASQIILDLAHDYDVILAVHSSFSRNILPRVAALLDVAMVSDVLEIKTDNSYVRAIYAGDIHATVQNTSSKQLLTIRSSYFPAAEQGNQADITSIAVPAPFTQTEWLSESRSQSDLPELGTAKVVVSGGRSLGSAEQFNTVMSPLAHKLGGALGATRAAVDAGYAPNEIQVGQTGVIVAPDLYIAVGISGAVQHTAGMKDSRVVVAINSDPDAPIFQVADYGLVADLFDAVPQLVNAIQ